MKAFLRKSIGFIKALSLDDRIPAWDKGVLAAMVALLVSPVDFISDFIPVLGQLDDIVILIVMLDYIMNRLPEAILLDHWPWNPDKLKAWRKRLRFLSMLVPNWIQNRIWAIQVEKAGEAAGPGAEKPA
jgi:uncharacterized membrane protein YkvA (DUF1232 family)